MRHPSGIDRKCSVSGCERKHYGHDRCKFHYQQWYRSPEYRPLPRAEAQFRTAAERLWEKVDFLGPNGCWLWTGAKGRGGYGHLSIGHERLVKAHRLSYELKVGPIAKGLVLDHLCRRPACVNPYHLEPVTPLENTLRGVEARQAHRDAMRLRRAWVRLQRMRARVA